MYKPHNLKKHRQFFKDLLKMPSGGCYSRGFADLMEDRRAIAPFAISSDAS